ncbi:MAG: hypothetical protein Unbinned96contig1001_12 [Prokaryotic dsDNA virus sp.]|nr:MAG: hypothetical protein Unbinned96contig1001_12 [Prokaryotic dsDNA virus sp.]|tara:strand:+ start:7096 stop:7596 length:501 start_codon:yes stop_codon:yes gene_type:complete
MKIKMFKGYEVWSDGSIRNKNSCSFKKPTLNPKGYAYSQFYYEGASHGWLWHRFVAEAFLGTCPDGYEVNHKNGIRDDNRLCNLEYLTKSQNNQLSYDSGRRVVSGTNNANCKLTEAQVRVICDRLERGAYKSIAALGRELQVSKHTIHSIKKKLQWLCISKDYNF